jgi:thiol-disulfide isomerase/thioredoxin
MHRHPRFARFCALALALVLFGFFGAIVGLTVWGRGAGQRLETASRFMQPMRLASFNQGGGPSLKGGVEWINSGPISLQQLRGKIVLLDFWTYCCINCHHVLPDLAKLEEKYKSELVVIGVHSAKFDAEKDTENIRRKVAEYRIKHPVVNDAHLTIWKRFGVQSWPTIVLIDANGNYVDQISGEGHYDALDRAVGELVEMHKAKGELNLAPLKFSPEMERPVNGPLLYPGKVLADERGKRLFIADTGHNRIIQASLSGDDPIAIGSGEEGLADGDYAKAAFNRPQGMCIDGDTLYVADTENHAIRAVDLKQAKVTTVAGVGSQARRIFPPGSSDRATTTPLSSPWDVIQIPPDKGLYIAMAGSHQIWKLDIERDLVSVFAGTGYENINLETVRPDQASFAQPSGLASDGENLFIADSEVSGVRAITGIGAGKQPAVRTIVGTGLFAFGDNDGRAAGVRLQHCLGLAYGDGHLYIADTYNNKVKICTPKTRLVKTLVGAHKPGDSENPPRFYQPGGLSLAGSDLYVADSNNHKIRIVDLKTNTVKTLALAGLGPPRLEARPPSFPNAKTITVANTEQAPASAIKIAISIPLSKDYKLNDEAPMPVLVETPGKTGILSPDVPAAGQKIKPPRPKFSIDVPLSQTPKTGDSLDLRVSVAAFVCKEASSLCQIRSFVWNVPITWTDTDKSEAIELEAALE